MLNKLQDHPVALQEGINIKTNSCFMKNHLLILVFFAYSLFLSGLSLSGQNQAVVIARFSNPVLVCGPETYCVDVEFQSDADNIRLFAMNVRLFFDDELLSFIGFTDFAEGYAPVSPNPPFVNYLAEGAGNTLFGFAGEAVFINGAVQLVNSGAPPIFISPDSWTKLFSICFSFDMTSINTLNNVCPAIIWDLQEDPSMGSFFPGSEGVVILMVNPEPDPPTLPVTENVIQFNWDYTCNAGFPYGQPQESDCILNPCNNESIVILPGQNLCFESEGPLIIGGDPPAFTVEALGSAFLVSPVSIVLKPGTVVKQGANMRAYISEEGCVQPQSLLMSTANMDNDFAEPDQFDSNLNLFRVYPNPTSGVFTIEFNESGEYLSAMAEVYNMSGELILRQMIVTSQVHHLDIAHAGPGFYLVRVIRNDQVGVQKLLKY